MNDLEKAYQVICDAIEESGSDEQFHDSWQVKIIEDSNPPLIRVQAGCIDVANDNSFYAYLKKAGIPHHLSGKAGYKGQTLEIPVPDRTTLLSLARLYGDVIGSQTATVIEQKHFNYEDSELTAHMAQGSIQSVRSAMEDCKANKILDALVGDAIKGQGHRR